MNSHQPFRAGFFTDVAAAERAIAALRSFGFATKQIAIICPERFRSAMGHDIPIAERPANEAPERIIEGSVIGGTLGGIALAVTTLATGGLGLLPGAMVLIGGGALAGGFSTLIVEDGYQKGIGEYYVQAIANDQIAVGVYAENANPELELAEAGRIFRNAGAVSIAPDDDPSSEMNS